MSSHETDYQGEAEALIAYLKGRNLLPAEIVMIMASGLGGIVRACEKGGDDAVRNALVPVFRQIEVGARLPKKNRAA